VIPRLGNAEVVWRLNLGIPARDFDAKSIKEAFLIAAIAGWHIASEKGAINITRAATVVNLARQDNFRPEGTGREMIEVIPEVAAGVTAYARSAQRRPGAHLFIDVGATTFDTSFFLLDQSLDGLRYVFLAAEVDSHLGAIRLHRYRADQLGRLALARFAASDPLKPIPATPLDCVPPSSEIAEMDTPFREVCVQNLAKVVWAAKMKDPSVSVPDNSRAEPIQVLLSGGGIRLPLYQHAIRETGRRVKPGGGLGLRIRPFQEATMPRPEDLQASSLSEDEWSRLAIAYGLSYAAEDIGEFVPPSEVSAPPPLPHRDDRERFVSKDQV
jgi:hypothetical protein